MKIVLLEGLGVSDAVLERHAQKLAQMGHTFVAYPKDATPAVQAERSRDADVIMLANMPLDPSVLDTAKHLKFTDMELEVKVDGEVVYHKRVPQAAPGEMESVQITKQLAEKLTGQTVEIGLRPAT